MKNEQSKEYVDLPVDRKQLFFGKFKSEYATILLCSLFQTLFALPLYALLFMALLEGAAASKSADPVAMFAVRRWFYVFSVPCLLVFSVGASGVSEVMKNVVWSQNNSFFKEFSKGIKNNALQFSVVTALYGLFVSSVAYISDVLSLSAGTSLAKAIAAATAVTLTFIATGVLMFEYSAITVYKSNVFGVIKNSFVLCLGTLPKTACILFLILLPFLLLALIMASVWLFVILMTAFAVAGFGYMFFIGTLYTHYVFDKHINIKDFKSIYRKGLYCTKSDDEKH